MALGGVLYWLGENESALANLERGFAFCDSQQRRSSLVVHDTGVGCLMLSARTLWHLGFPDRALARAREGIALAQALTHPYNIVWSQSHLISLYVARREMSKALQIAESTSRAASEHSFSILGAIGTCHQEWLLSMQGEGREELIQLQHAIADMKSSGAFILSYYRALIAERYCIIGKTEEGLVELAEALTLVDETGARFYEAELHRLKGQLLLQQSPDNATEAETCFHQAISIAQTQSAKSWELRAATSLAKLWQQQNERQKAYDLLAPVYGWFTEGFDTADLKDARALLDELA